MGAGLAGGGSERGSVRDGPADIQGQAADGSLPLAEDHQDHVQAKPLHHQAPTTRGLLSTSSI